MKLDKHIVILTPGFPKNEGDEKCMPYLHLFIKHLIDHYQEYHISVITLQYPHYEAKYRWNNIDVYGCGGHDKKFPGRVLTWLKCLDFFKYINTHRRVDIIHSFWLNECAFLGNYLSKRFDASHLCTLMGQDVKRPNIYFTLLPLSRMRLIAVSDFQKRIFFEHTGLTTPSVIPWGVDNICDERINNDGSGIDILGVGSLLPIKNYSLFIDIVSALQKEYPSLKTLLVGEGPEHHMLTNKIKALKLTDSVKLTGALPRKKVLSLMCQSKVLLHTSHFESYGFVFSEALASGMSIVSFEVGIAEHMEEWRVCRSTQEMMESLKFFLFRKKPLKKVTVRYSVAETTNKYIELYDSLDAKV